MRAFLLAAAVVGLTTLTACASLRNDVISGYCGADPREARWTLVEPPADAETYRAIARADGSTRRPEGDEYWLAHGDEIKYCITPLRRSSTVPERNGSNCDDRIGVWWIFQQTPSGPVTRGVEEQICLT